MLRPYGRLQRAAPYDEKLCMSSNLDLTSLSRVELVALVQQLRQQVNERDQEIVRLRRRLGEENSLLEVPQTASSALQESPTPGSQEDLFALLEKIYPEGR